MWKVINLSISKRFENYDTFNDEQYQLWQKKSTTDIHFHMRHFWPKCFERGISALQLLYIMHWTEYDKQLLWIHSSYFLQPPLKLGGLCVTDFFLQLWSCRHMPLILDIFIILARRTFPHYFTMLNSPEVSSNNSYNFIVNLYKNSPSSLSFLSKIETVEFATRGFFPIYNIKPWNANNIK